MNGKILLYSEESYLITLCCIALLQTFRWRCVECVVHHVRDVRGEEQHHIYM